jgi:predicted tellurium resistance membrane protein TerC
MFEELLDPANLFTVENLIAFIALAAMEIVLGIDNLVYIAIVSGRLPADQQPAARKLGLALALVTRLALLFVLSYIVRHLQSPVFDLTSLGLPENLLERFSGSEAGSEGFEEANGVSWKDIVLFTGGLFLVWKSVHEIHQQFGHDPNKAVVPPRAGFGGVVAQIAVMDIVFSLDSVITAVGMAESLTVMTLAIIMAMAVMLIFAERVSRFIEQHPTLKMLALSFLILIGVMLVAEGIGAHLDKGYIYFAMAFAMIVELLNLGTGRRVPADKPVKP